MRPICWIHISEIHIRLSDAWAQDIVLKAMCEHISRQSEDGTATDFILVTGDLAFSGKADEYALVAEFFDKLITVSGVSKEHIFCVPGNHDVDCDRQKLCFQGARVSLQDQNRTDVILEAGEDLETLLKRQENYRDFQNSYFKEQDRTWTDDGLSYVSRLSIEDVRLVIIGLDSAWLAEGGIGDHGKLIIGERQVINAINLVQKFDDPPHIILGMAHHPFHLLQEFDRLPVQNRVEQVCQFFHCGHLHELEARATGQNGTGCLTLAAGSSFETRQSHNTYSLVTLDLLGAVRTVTTIQYDPGNGAFLSKFPHEYRIEVTPSDTCSVSELAQAMKTFCPALAPWAHYLSALLLDHKAELLIPSQNGYTFGSFNVLQGLPDSELKRKTVDFLTFRNAFRVLYKRVSFSDIFARHGDTVEQYGDVLKELCKADSALKNRLAAQENDAHMLANAEPRESFPHTGALLSELATAQDWDLLRVHAQRHVNSADPAIAIQAKRMLALSLAHSEVAADKRTTIDLYRSLAGGDSAKFSDVGNLATLLIEAGSLEDAKAAVLVGIARFPAKTDYFSQIGQRIVEATGDRFFRKQIEGAIVERGKLD